MDTSAWSFRSPDPAVAALVDAFFAGYDPAAGLPDPELLGGPERARIDAATPAWWQAGRADRWEAFDPYALSTLGLELFAEDLPSLRPRLGELAVPVTVIVGADDQPYAQQAPELAAAAGADELVVVAGALHSPQLTHAEPWADAVARHLARVEDRPA